MCRVNFSTTWHCLWPLHARQQLTETTMSQSSSQPLNPYPFMEHVCRRRRQPARMRSSVYVRIDLLSLFFNAPRTCCCWWLCLELKKRPKTVRTRGCARCINNVHRRETVEKERFVRASRKSARTVRNRGFVRFIHTVHRGAKTVLHVFPTESGAAQ